MPQISFLLPVHNGARYLSETLASVLAQDHADFDVLIVDDGSTDATPEVVGRIADPRVRYVRQPHSGLVDALNNGIARLDCAYVARIDADDLCVPTRLTEQQDFLEFTGGAAVSCRALHIDEVGNVTGLSAAQPIFGADPTWLPATEPYLPHPFLFARRDILAEVGLRHAHLAEDADLCWRMAERWPIAMQGSVLGCYRLHPGSLSVRTAEAVRVQAFYSQLAALNAVRRQAGREEVPYDAEMDEALLAAEGGWSGLLRLHARHLSPDETTRLRAAAPLKFLDISRWRGLTPDIAEISAAAAALREVRDLNDRNWRSAFRLVAELSPDTGPAPDWGVSRGLSGLLSRRTGRRAARRLG